MDYKQLAQLAYDTVLQTMTEGEAAHGLDKWKTLSQHDHLIRGFRHMVKAIYHQTDENHLAHALTRCAMAIYKGDKP